MDVESENCFTCKAISLSFSLTTSFSLSLSYSLSFLFLPFPLLPPLPPCKCFLQILKAALFSYSAVLECDEQLLLTLSLVFPPTTENTQTQSTAEPGLGSGVKVGLDWLCGVSCRRWEMSILTWVCISQENSKKLPPERGGKRFFFLYQTYITCKITGCHFKIVGVGMLLSWKLHETILFRKYYFRL